MSKENSVAVTDDAPKVDVPKHKGFSIDEIRYRRALVALKKDFCKEKVMLHREKIANSSPFSKGYKAPKGTMLGRTGAIVSKLMGGLNYLDYIMMGVSVFQTGRKVLGVFHKKK